MLHECSLDLFLDRRRERDDRQRLAGNAELVTNVTRQRLPYILCEQVRVLGLLAIVTKRFEDGDHVADGHLLL